MPGKPTGTPTDGGIDIAQLLKQQEGQWFERKSRRIEPRALADTMAGFANAEGGVIVVGVHNGRIEGLAGADENAFRQAAIDFTDPPVRHRFETVPCRLSDGSEGELAVVTVDAAEGLHRNVRDEVFLRVGDETRRLNAAQARELEYDKGHSVYDGRPAAGATMEDLDAAAIERYVRAVRGRTPASDLLLARGLAVRAHEALSPTVAGILVLGRQPQQLLLEAFVRVLRYQGLQRETGSRSNVLDDRRFEGPLTSQIDKARRWLQRNVPPVTRLGQAGRFEQSTIVPPSAWLEALVNAVIHRSYSMVGDHIRVEVFGDRVEVESPGRLPGLVRLDNIRSTRFARNPRIARAMADLGYGRELGEGVDRMFDEMHRAGLPEPIYEQRPASLRVSLVAAPGIDELTVGLPPAATALFERIISIQRVTTTEAVEMTGRSRPTTLHYLRLLESRGLVVHTGTSRKDPRGAWEVMPPVAPPVEAGGTA